MKIFLTGATGFMGGELLKALHARGHEITALVRDPEKAKGIPAGVQLSSGAVENLHSYRAQLPGQDAVVHVAALVKMWVRDSSEFDRINVEATHNMIRAAADAGIPKFVYASSFMALGPSNGKPLTEEDPRRLSVTHNDYERTKFLADQAARKLIADGLPVYILYPGIIYGPGNLTAGNIVARNLIPFLNGKMPFGLPLLAWSYVTVHDVVNGFIKVIEGNPPSRRYILGGDNQTGEAFYKTVQEVTGKKPPAFNMPFSVAKLAGYGEYGLALLFGREPRLLTHQVVEIYKHSWAYDSSLAQKEIGYTITPLKDGLIEMIGWLKNARLVK